MRHDESGHRSKFTRNEKRAGGKIFGHVYELDCTSVRMNPGERGVAYQITLSEMKGRGCQY